MSKMNFKDYLTEANGGFGSDIEAADYMKAVADNMNDPKLVNWAKEFDKNNDSAAHDSLKKAAAAYKDFLGEAGVK